MKLKRFFAALTAGLVVVLNFGCGLPPTGGAANNTDSPDWLDPEVTRISAPGYEDETHETAKSDTTADSTTVTSKAPETTLPKSNESRVSFLAAGDNIIHEQVFVDAKNRVKNGEKYDFASMYDGVKDFIAAADLAFVNQETPLGGDELGISGYPNFNGPQAAGTALVDVGFDIVNIATNHMLDKKEAGLKGSIDFWNSQPVTLLGGYYDDDDYENIRVVEKNGIKIAFVSYTYGLNGMTLPASSKIHIPLIDSDEIVRMVKKAKTLADVTICVMHWGTDGSTAVTNEQKTLAKAITDAGADVILGMHSHTIQPVEWQTGKNGNKTLVIYSLGNFLNAQYDSINLVGGIITFDIVKKDGEVSIENPVMNPVVVQYNAERLGFQLYLLENYTPELAGAHGTVRYGTLKTFTVDTAKGFVTKAVDKDFLPDYLK